MAKIVGLILAAGKSTRFKGDTPKFLHFLLGKRIIDYVTDAVRPFVDELFYVSSAQHLVHPDAIIQHDARGTGHAVMTALSHIKADKVLIVFGDTPFVSSETIQRMCASTTAITISAFKDHMNKSYGRVDPVSKKITQYKDASDQQKQNPLCHAGIMMVDYQVLTALLPRLSTNNQAQEYYLTDIVNMFDGEIGLVEGAADEFIGIDTRFDLAMASTALHQKLTFQHMANGVTFHGFGQQLAYDTKLGVDVEVGANVVFGPNVIVEKNVQILPFCYLENCYIKSHCVVGPFARIRGGTVLDEGAEIGNFVEVKKSTIGKKSKAKHHAYLGDAIIGECVNIGAGTITCNYDGKNKTQTIIKDGAFIGSNVNLIAPITVGADSYIGAGSTVSKNVEPNTLVVERAEEKRKDRNET